MALASASRMGSTFDKSKVKVIVVDDSAVVRGLTRRFLEENPKISIVGTASNGKAGVDMVEAHDVDVVVLDIEMPVMDGLTAIPLMLKARPGLKIVMSSTLTRTNASASIKAMAAGASDYVAKPSSGNAINNADDFQRELVSKVLALGGVTESDDIPLPAGERGKAKRGPTLLAHRGKKVTLRDPGIVPPRAIAIGSSTGGPQALVEVVKGLDKSLPHPIFITQHMPPTFTAILAEHLARDSGRAVHEATDGQQVKDGEMYLAPGDYHMLIEKKGSGLTVKLTQTERENFCRPSVDPMLRSLVEIYGNALLTVILTGMGHDGLSGGQLVVEKGGTVFAQDEKTSVVWGMPGAVATAGVCAAVRPLKDIAPLVNSFIKGGRL